MAILVRKIGIVFACFSAITAIAAGQKEWLAVLALTAGYIVINAIAGRSGMLPPAAGAMLMLGICAAFTLFHSPYSSILYHLLLLTTALEMGKTATKRAAVVIILTYAGMAAYTAEGFTLAYCTGVGFNVLGFYALTYTIVHVQTVMDKRNTDSSKLKDLIDKSNQHYRMALTDGLTGLYNYRAYKEKIDTIPQYIILVIDIDHFKRLNDTYGHAVGDKVLVRLGNIIKLSIRNCDFAFRYGGEEFVIVLPGAAPQLGLAIAERLRAKVCQSEFVVGASRIPVTVSIGFSVKHPSMSSGQAFEQADQALYRAKQQGRNNVQYHRATNMENIPYQINCNC